MDDELAVARADSNKLAGLLTEIFSAAGLKTDDAKIVASNLISAEMRGIHSHGIVKTAQYARRMINGEIHTAPNIHIIKEMPATLTIDADYAAGAVAGVWAMDQAIAKAKQAGAAVAAVQHGTHYGMSAFYAMRALPDNMIGLAFTNSPRLMATFGGYKRELGTNPICIAIPAKKHRPLVYDGATSIAAYNKCYFAFTEGRKIPDDWALNSQGFPTDNPEDVIVGKGAVLPFGGYKGSDLAMMINILTGMLSGGCSKILPTGQVREDIDETAYNFMAIDISAFTDLDIFLQTVDLFAERLKSTPVRPGENEVLLPGEKEDRFYEESKKLGVVLYQGTAQSISQVAAELGVNTSLESTLVEEDDLA